MATAVSSSRQTVAIASHSPAAAKATASIRPMAISPTTAPLPTTSTPTATVMPTTVSQHDPSDGEWDVLEAVLSQAILTQYLNHSMVTALAVKNSSLHLQGEQSNIFV